MTLKRCECWDNHSTWKNTLNMAMTTSCYNTCWYNCLRKKQRQHHHIHLRLEQATSPRTMVLQWCTLHPSHPPWWRMPDRDAKKNDVTLTITQGRQGERDAHWSVHTGCNFKAGCHAFEQVEQKTLPKYCNQRNSSTVSFSGRTLAPHRSLRWKHFASSHANIT